MSKKIEIMLNYLDEYIDKKIELQLLAQRMTASLSNEEYMDCRDTRDRKEFKLGRWRDEFGKYLANLTGLEDD